MAYSRAARTSTGRIRIRRRRVAALLVVGVAAIAGGFAYRALAPSSSTVGAPTGAPRGEPRRVLGAVWPAQGQAAVVLTGQSQVQAGPNQHAAPIASVAKVMTAYLVLRDHPLRPGEDGPTITLSDADVADTDRRRGHEESVVSIVAGEQLSERQALQALLLPSANNIAAGLAQWEAGSERGFLAGVLAQWDAGSQEGFVGRMNAAARSLGMIHTRYPDPSGYDDATVSTAVD